jgi:hypothetical protein
VPVAGQPTSAPVDGEVWSTTPYRDNGLVGTVVNCADTSPTHVGNFRTEVAGVDASGRVLTCTAAGGQWKRVSGGGFPVPSSTGEFRFSSSATCDLRINATEVHFESGKTITYTFTSDVCEPLPVPRTCVGQGSLSIS